MENMSAEEMAEKIAQAMEMSRKKAEQKREKDQAGKGKSTAILKTKTKAPPRARASKRSAGEASVPDQEGSKRRSLVDEDELQNSPSGKMLVRG